MRLVASFSRRFFDMLAGNECAGWDLHLCACHHFWALASFLCAKNVRRCRHGHRIWPANVACQKSNGHTDQAGWGRHLRSRPHVLGSHGSHIFFTSPCMSKVPAVTQIRRVRVRRPCNRHRFWVLISYPFACQQRQQSHRSGGSGSPSL